MKEIQDTQYTISIDLSMGNQRLDRFARKLYKPYTTVTLPMIYSWIRKGYIRINGKKGAEATKIIIGDVITINTSKTIPLRAGAIGKKTSQVAEEDINRIRSHIIYESPERLVFNKPPRMLMHPGSGQSQKAITMNDWLYSCINMSNPTAHDDGITPGSTFKPAFCFRLDKDTSGVLIAAKKYDALQYLNERIKKRETTKRYIVVTNGKLPEKMIIDKPLFKGFHAEKGRAHMFVNYEKGVEAKTSVYNIATKKDSNGGYMSLGLVRLFTGRMHQIRVHLVSEGFPILGDREYGNSDIAAELGRTHNIHRQLLHSFFYQFHDQKNARITYIAPIPPDIQQLFPDITESMIEKKIHTLL